MEVSHNKDVYIQACMDLDSIDIGSCSFKVVCEIEMFWVDNTITCEDDISNLSSPLNWQDAADNAVVEESLGDELHRIQEGVDENNEKVTYIQGKYFLLLECTECFEMASFPCDNQVCNVILTVDTEEWNVLYKRPSYVDSKKCFLDNGEDQMVLVRAGPKAISEYQLEDPVVDCEKGGEFIWKLCVTRKLPYYIYGIFVPILTILICNVPVAALGVDDIADRLGTCGNTYLSLLVFQFIVQEAVPPGGELSIMDIYILLCSFSVVIAIFENMLFEEMFVNGKNVDTAIYLDRYFYIAFAAFWVVFHIIMITYLNYMTISWLDTFAGDEGDVEWFPPQGTSTFHGFTDPDGTNYCFVRAKDAALKDELNVERTRQEKL